VTRAGRILVLLASVVSLAPADAAHGGTVTAPQVRTYYIAADEVAWNYAPKGRNLTGTPRLENEGAS